MKNFTDEELADLADWAEKNERSAANPDAKRAYGAMRQGADWLLRLRTKERAAVKTVSSSAEAGNGPELKPQ